MIHTMAFHAYTPIQNNIVVHALCIWGHTYSMYANVSENLTFLTPRYTYMYVHIGPGEGGGVGVRKCYFSGNFVYIL